MKLSSSYHISLNIATKQSEKLGFLHLCRVGIRSHKLRRLQAFRSGTIYCTPEIREEVFKILEEIIPENTDKNNGRPGMELWKILVLGTMRLNCNWDYDKLREIANNHKTLRKMLGHGLLDDEYDYALQTLKDNVSLLTPEVLDKINQIVVKAGHKRIFSIKRGILGRVPGQAQGILLGLLGN